MGNTRLALEHSASHLDESMGLRQYESHVKLSPVASPRDVGRRPLRSFGRVDVSMVEPDSSQPRTEFSEEAIGRLAQSIREKGQLHPIRVRWSEDRDKWLIVSGERRWRASTAAGLQAIDCYFLDRDLEPSEILEEQLVENLLREDLKPMDQARAFSGLMELNGWNGKQVAEALRISPSTVSRSLALLDLPADVQQQIDAGDLAARSGYELSKLANPSTQRDLASGETLTHEKARSASNQRRGKSARKKRGFRQTFFADDGFKIIVSSPTKTTYDHVERALQQVLDEVRHYVDQGRSIL